MHALLDCAAPRFEYLYRFVIAHYSIRMKNISLRPRRLRMSRTIREITGETRLTAENFVLPYFVRTGSNSEVPIKSMPGISQFTVDRLIADMEEPVKNGLRAVLLFGLPDKKNSEGSSAWDSRGPVPAALRAIKKYYPEVVTMADVCMCEYTDHGHCGPLTETKLGEVTVDNDKALLLHARIATAYAEAGADVVAPSGMMDGVVGAIREKLDQSGFIDTTIMAYSAKYASSFYGPFRDAAESPPKSGDRKTYQMSPMNSREALREVELDIEEGADIVMVKPALAYLDIIRMVRDEFILPVAAYNVSGEYSMLKAAIEKNWLSYDAVAETLLSIRRAGADIIISYFAREIFKEDSLIDVYRHSR